MTDQNYYYDYRKEYVINKINDEINFYENCEYANYPSIKQYLQYLKNRIGTDKIETSFVTHYDKAGNKQEIKKMNLEEYVKNIDIDTFTKPWNKLKEIHKMMKIKEYVDNLDYGNETRKSQITKNKDYLKREICEGLKDKKFAKNKSVIEYDSKNMMITSISCLEYNDEIGLYEIDWSE